MREIEKYGNELTIVGMVVGNEIKREIIMLPDESAEIPIEEILYPSKETLDNIIKQLDIVEITDKEKTILRKTQRNIEQKVSWRVYRRDGYACRYCGADDVPLTVDHVVRWEMLGASVPENLLTSCRKCNKTRGGTEYPEWLQSEYYLRVSQNLTEKMRQKNIEFWDVAVSVPLRPRRRSR